MKEIYNVILLRMPDGVELVLDDCEELKMETDRNRLTQILTNLLTNAIKHTRKGFIRFGYRKVDSSVEFFVQDSGEGIPEDKIKMIFSRFVQLDDWSKGCRIGTCHLSGIGRANERKDMGNLEAGRRIGLLCGFTFDT